MRGHRLLAALAATGLLVAAGCGDDDDDDASDTTEADAGTTATTAATEATDGADSSTPPSGDVADVDPEFADVCAVAQEIYESDSFPTADQLQRYQAVAPDEIKDAVETAAPPLIAADDDPVALLAVFAQDDIESASAEIDAFENEHCGIQHDPPSEQGPEDGAAVVEVTATDYAFDAPTQVEAGRTSFVLTNNGEEAHFLGIFRPAEGHTVQEALEYEGDPMADGLIEEDLGGTGLAAPGGDTEFLTVDLEPGTYGIYCFLPGPGGTPHVFMGMQGELTVT